MAYINYFSNCQFVKGANRSLISDLQLQVSYPISNAIFEVLIHLKEHSIEECIQFYGPENEEAIRSYIDFVLDRGIGFVDTEIRGELSSLDLQWDSPAEISNVIVEYSESQNYEGEFYRSLFDSNIQALELRCYDQIDLDRLKTFIASFNGKVLKYIKVVIPYSLAASPDYLYELVKTNLRVRSILLHSAPSDRETTTYKDSVEVRYLTRCIDSNAHCGAVRTAHFMTNMELFTESQQHNTCLNRKLAIDRSGFIKNCPSTNQVFGHVDRISLDQLLQHPDLKKLWFIHKDQIEVCRDCEFRHICTDCRAFTEKPQDLFSKPLKCGYDPYTSTWSEWSTHPLKQAAMQYYKSEEIKN